jgi:hypothetical protein
VPTSASARKGHRRGCGCLSDRAWPSSHFSGRPWPGLLPVFGTPGNGLTPENRPSGYAFGLRFKIAKTARSRGVR